MNTRIIHISFQILLLCAVFSLHGFAEGPGYPRDKILEPGVRMLLIGPFAGIDYNIHRGFFTTREGNITCCEFDEGSGIGFAGGMKAFIPITEKWMFSPRILYENRGGDFNGRIQSYPIFGQNNSVEYVDLETALEVNLHTITLDAFAGYVMPFLGAYITAGPSLSYLLSNRFKVTEKIIHPPGVRFLDGSVSKQVFDSDMTITNTMFIALRGGIGMNFEIARDVYINPELLYSFPLNKVSKENDWKMSGIQATLGLLFAF